MAMNNIISVRFFLAAALAAYLPFQAVAAAADNPTVRFSTTFGNIDIELYPDKAPLTVRNFLRLVDDSFYDGLVFHRVVANFVIQAGGYDANLSYREPPGTILNESKNGLPNRKGSIAMARLPDPDSASSQFFINTKHNPNLDATRDKAGYTVFGQVIAGMEVVAEIELVDTHLEGGMSGVPEKDVVISRATRL